MTIVVHQIELCANRETINTECQSVESGSVKGPEVAQPSEVE